MFSARTEASTRMALSSLVALTAVALLVILSSSRAGAEGAGAVDPAFAPTFQSAGKAADVAVQPDGKILVVGNFTHVGSVPRPGLARLLPDGSVDTTFDPPDLRGMTSASLHVVRALANGKVLVGTDRPSRLNADGSLDVTFQGASWFWDVFDALELSDGSTLVAGLIPGFWGGVNHYEPDGSLNDQSSASTDYPVRTMALLPDGKLLIGGWFTSVRGTPRSYIARINADGSVDPSFNPTIGGTYPVVYSVCVLSDGSYVVAGTFSYVNGVGRDGLARLFPDGAVDPAFNPGSTLNGWVNRLLPAPGNSVLAVGSFSTVGGASRANVARLLVNGSADPAFDPGLGPDREVISGALLPTGSAVLGGDFTYYGNTAQFGLARVTSTGALDSGLAPGLLLPSSVEALVRLDDGRLVVGGAFDLVNGAPQSGVARLNADGTRDTTFGPVARTSGVTLALAVQPDGKILAGGSFTQICGVTRARVARLNADGSLDEGFDPGSGADRTVHALALQGNGKVLVGGEFYTFDGAPRPALVRLEADGALDSAFLADNPPDGYVRAIVPQPDGKIVIGGGLASVGDVAVANLARLDSSGTLDTTFGISGSGALETGGVFGASSDAAGSLLIGGNFSSVQGTARHSAARLTADGHLDHAFGLAEPTAGTVMTVAAQADGKVVLGGNASLLGGAQRNGIARFLANGSLDPEFHAGSGVDREVRALAVEPSGAVVIAGDFQSVNRQPRTGLARLLPDTLGGYDLTIQFPGSGNGSVQDAAAGVSCGTTCVVGIPAGVNATLTATADAGSIFDGWGGECTGMGACEVTGDQPHSVTATFSFFPLVPQGIESVDEIPGWVVPEPDGVSAWELSDLNGVFEPGETVAVSPRWKNIGDVPVEVWGTALVLIGPPGTGPFSINLSRVYYGQAAPGATVTCQEFGEGCYAVSAGPMALRPASHIDAALTEALDNGALRSWTLHIGDSFADVPRSHFAYRFVETFLHSGLTAGCSPTEFCPSDTVTRWQTAVFLASAMTNGEVPASGTVPGLGDYNCTPGGTTVFDDVPPADGGCRFIHYLAREGVTAGCDVRAYCPTDPTTRWQSAVLLAAALAGGAVPVAGSVPGLGSYNCQPGGITLFDDVPPEDPGCRFVHYLAAEGITAGCGPRAFCPQNALARAEAAVFLVAAYDYTLY